ncbi:MAG: 23S rRNA (guanosine(2251)-2'-O)-methyltransferase RlmB [Bacteroidota bacterium]
MAKKELIYGIHPMLEAAKSGQAFDKVFIRKGLKGPNVEQIKQLLHQQEIPLQSVPVEKLNRLTGKNHQGIIGQISPVPFQKIEDLIPGLFEAGKTPFILILDQISDIRNFGAITRTAEAAGVDALVIPGRGAASINADAMKTSAGALNYIPVCRSSNLAKTCDFLVNSGIAIAAATEKSQQLYYEQDLSGPIALIMGSEGEGISQALLEKAQIHLSLPMKGNISSLNVSVAAGILIYEVVRQRD